MYDTSTKSNQSTQISVRNILERMIGYIPIATFLNTAYTSATPPPPCRTHSLGTLRLRLERAATDRPHPADIRRGIVIVLVVVRDPATKFGNLDRDVFRFREEEDEQRKREARRRGDREGGQEGELLIIIAFFRRFGIFCL